MRLDRACIPLSYAWSSPFVRWQGALADLPTIDLAADLSTRALAERNLPASEFATLVLGWTIPQAGLFYGAPTLAARIGAPGITGPMVSQACATGAAALQTAALQVEANGDDLVLAVTADRLSNSPMLVLPSGSGPGGSPKTEHWLLEAMARDPWAGESMLTTAEKVASDGGTTRQELDDLTLLRYEQYQRSLADDRAFQRRYMVAVHVPSRKQTVVVDADTGIHPTTSEGLAKLAPVQPDGVITYGTQTHPADAAAGVVVTTEQRARDLSPDGVARVLGTGWARVEKAEMPKAAVPAAQNALRAADLDIADVDVVTTHNPFAVNDVWFSQQTGFPAERMNPYGCSLIYGHPHSATGMRAITELIEALRERGGGIGLFTGCAAGDTGDAVVVRVED
jgi:acetyl-CoA acetyltransferase family protein